MLCERAYDGSRSPAHCRREKDGRLVQAWLQPCSRSLIRCNRQCAQGLKQYDRDVAVSLLTAMYEGRRGLHQHLPGAVRRVHQRR